MTCLGINNEGHLVFDYYHEDTDQLNGEDVYNGQNSTLWCNFREAFAEEIQETYQNLRNNNKLTYDKVIEHFITNGSKKWSASIYNEDSDYKYISMLRTDNDATNLYQIRGNGEEHLKYFIKNRLNYCDSKWYASDYANNYISLRIYTPNEWAGVEPNADITIIPFSDMYAGVRYKANGTLQQIKVNRNEEITFTAPDETFIDTETAIYGASEISSLCDLAPLYCGSINVSKASRLINLKIGDATEGYINTHLTELSVGTNRLLKTIDVRNCPNLTEPLALSGCPNIEEIYATGSGITGIELADSGYLKTLHLPDTLSNLTISSQLFLTDFVVDGYENLQTLNIDNCPTIDVFNIIDQAPNLNRLRLSRVDWHFNDASRLLQLYDANYAGVDENGLNIDAAHVSGKCHIELLTGAELAKIIEAFPYLDITYTSLSSYLVFMAGDGVTELCRQAIANGGNGYDPVKAEELAAPTRETDAQYTYTYANGWSEDINATEVDVNATRNIEADRYLYPVFIRTLRRYTVSFYNEGELLQITTGVPYGSSVVFEGETPVISIVSDPENYGFVGWSPSPDFITGDTVCYAQFRYIGIVTYKLLGKDYNGGYYNERINTVGDCAFYEQENLTSVNFPMVTSIGNDAFSNCANLTNIDMPNVTSIGGNAFYDCNSLTSVNFPNVTSIGVYAFANCRKLTNIDMPNVTSIGGNAFYYCSSLTSVNFPNVTSIGQRVFDNCHRLTNVKAPNINIINNSAFSDCRNLTSVNLPNVTYVGREAFYYCINLTSVNMPNVTHVGYSAFLGCSNLTSVNMPNLTSIDQRVFDNCHRLTNVKAPNINIINNSAFSDCRNLTSFNLSSAATFRVYAFRNCYNLTALILRSNELCTLQATNAFTNTPIGNKNNGYIYVPNSTINNYKNATNWSTYKNQFRVLEDYPEICGGE